MPKKQVKTRLTRPEMEEIIRGGGSIHHDGEIITTIAGLPDDVDLAGSEEDFEAAAAALDAEEEELWRKKQKLQERFRQKQGQGAETSDKKQTPAAEDLESLKVEELKELAEKRGIDLKGATKKADIIEAIKAGKAGQTQ